MPRKKKKTKLKWRRKMLRLIQESEYSVKFEGSRLRITRHQKTGRVQLFIWREHHERCTEQFDFIPTVRKAKALAEERKKDNW